MRKIFFILAVFLTTPALAAPVQEVKSKSGITAWLMEEHSQPIVAVSVAFRDAGAAYDPVGKEGRAFMVASLLSEGAGELDAQSFSAALEERAVRLNFSADDDNFYAHLQSLSEHKEKAFYYLGLALSSPRFEAEAVQRERTQTLATIAELKKKPSARLGRAWQKQVFMGHPYQRPNFGSKKSVENLETEDFREFVGHYLTRGNLVISVVGDITASELAELLDEHLGKLPENYTPETSLPEATFPDKAAQTLVKQDIPQTMVRFGMVGLKRSDADYIPAFVMNYILGGGTLTSRLGEEIREKNGLAYAVSSELSPMRHGAIFEGWFSTRNEKVGQALAAMKNTLKNFAQNGVSEKELADAKHYLIGAFAVGLDSNAKNAGFLNMAQLNNLGIDYIERRNNLINAVSIKQVNDVAKRLIRLDNLQVVMVGNPTLGEEVKNTKITKTSEEENGQENSQEDGKNDDNQR